MWLATGIKPSVAAEIGYGITDEYQGNGYATEAVSAVIDWAFSQPAVTQIKAEVEELNIPSRKVLQKAGFLPMGETGEEGMLFVQKPKITVLGSMDAVKTVKDGKKSMRKNLLFKE